MSQFVVYDTKSGEFWWDAPNVPRMFPDAAAAKKLLEDITKTWGNGTGFTIRRVDGQMDFDWFNKAQRSYNRGEWGRPEYVANIEAQTAHCLRLNPNARKDGSADLMFYKDAFAGMAGKLSAISLRGYLEKYRDMRSADIEFYERVHKLETLDNDGLLFASAPDDIVKVYTKFNPTAGGVSGSCMRHSLDYFKANWDCFIHPTYVYGAGDLAVAYLADKAGLTIARAVCWPDKKVYSRVYDETDLLHRALKKRGFVKSSAYFGDAPSGAPNFTGAKLLKIPHRDPRYEGCYVMPYIDEGIPVRDAGDHFVLSNAFGDSRPIVRSQHTSGWTMESPRATVRCERCSARTMSPYNVHDEMGVAHQWCQTCGDSYAYHDLISQRTFMNSVPKVFISGTRVSAWTANPANGFVKTCELTGDVYLRSTGIAVYKCYPADKTRRAQCARSVMTREDLIWQDCFTSYYFTIADVPREKVFTHEREWRWTALGAVNTGAAFRSDYNGKLYDIRYERYVQGNAANAKLFRVSATHTKGAKQRLNRGAPIGGGVKEPTVDKEDD